MNCEIIIQRVVGRPFSHSKADARTSRNNVLIVACPLCLDHTKRLHAFVTFVCVKETAANQLIGVDFKKLKHNSVVVMTPFVAVYTDCCYGGIRRFLYS